MRIAEINVLQRHAEYQIGETKATADKKLTALEIVFSQCNPALNTRPPPHSPLDLGAEMLQSRSP